MSLSRRGTWSFDSAQLAVGNQAFRSRRGSEVLRLVDLVSMLFKQS